MKRPPSFGLFTDNWLGSSRISMMTPAEEGAYIHLLVLAWNAPEMDCGLPSDDETLAIMSRLGTAWMNGSGKKVRACFEERDGRLYSARLSQEWARALDYQRTRQESAKHRWSERNTNAMRADMRTQCVPGKGREGKEEGVEETKTEGVKGKPKATRGGFKTWTPDVFREECARANHNNTLRPHELSDFIAYWLEPSSSGRPKFTLEPTWDTHRRMQTALRVVFAKNRTTEPRKKVDLVEKWEQEESEWYAKHPELRKPASPAAQPHTP